MLSGNFQKELPLFGVCMKVMNEGEESAILAVGGGLEQRL